MNSYFFFFYIFQMFRRDFWAEVEEGVGGELEWVICNWSQKADNGEGFYVILERVFKNK